MCVGNHRDLHNKKLTHMVIKMYYGQVLCRPAKDLADFAKTRKVLL